MGTLLNVKMMINGNILVFCRNDGQRLNTLKVHHLLNRPIERFIPRQVKNAKGIIYVCPEMTESAILKNLKGAEIEVVRRFKEPGTTVVLR